MSLQISILEDLMNRDYIDCEKVFLMKSWDHDKEKFMSNHKYPDIKYLSELNVPYYSVEMQLIHNKGIPNKYIDNKVKFFIKKNDVFTPDNTMIFDGDTVKTDEFLKSNFKVNEDNQSSLDLINHYINELNNIGFHYPLYKDEVDYSQPELKFGNKKIQFEIKRRWLIKSSTELSTKYHLTFSIQDMKNSYHSIPTENITFKITDGLFVRGKAKNIKVEDDSSRRWMKKDLFRIFFKIHKDVDFIEKSSYKRGDIDAEDFKNLVKLVEMYSI